MSDGNGGNIKKAYSSYIAWSKAIYIYARSDRNTHYLGRLTKLRQTGTVIDRCLRAIGHRRRERVLPILCRRNYWWSQGRY